MPDGSMKLPEFPGELSDHLPAQDPVPPDRWVDRFRHAWLLYVALFLAVGLWVAAIVTLVVLQDENELLFRILLPMVVLAPGAIFTRILILRILFGRDPVTPVRIDPRDR